MIISHRNQDGMVLVMVLIVLLASTLIGVAAIRTAATDIRIVGNDARFSRDMYLAEANINTTLCNTKEWIDLDLLKNKRIVFCKAGLDRGNPFFGTIGTNIKIESEGRGQPPRGSRYSVTSFEAGYFNITSVQGNAQIIVGAWKLYPKMK